MSGTGSGPKGKRGGTLIKRSLGIAAAAAAAALAFTGTASAATLSVDDDGADCSDAAYSSVQTAIDAASPGDTVSVCPGTYTEGSGAVGTNAITIAKSLTLKGAGADLVKIRPRRTTPTGGQIATNSPTIRDASGNIAAVTGGAAVPVTVDISGVTFDGNGVYSEVGVLYLDAGGSISRSRVTNVVTSEDSAASNFPGGYRSNQHGYGIAQVTAAASPPPGNSPRTLEISSTRVDKYNKLGILIDGATNDVPPLTASGVVNQGVIKGSAVIGRTLCTNFSVNGNCASVGLLTSGPLFGQDGIRVTAGSTLQMADSIVSQNLVLGTGAPTRNSATNNANLPLGAGARLIGAGASSISTSNVVDNAYGVNNLTLDGASPNTGTPVSAENNWWGLRYTTVTNNNGPAISPVVNPQVPENPVNGTPVADPACLPTTGPAVFNSDAVDFCPFRNGTQGDPNTGQFPLLNAPLPMADEGPSVSLVADPDPVQAGDSVSLEAEASDDFGVKSVTFYDGPNAIKIDSSPPFTASVNVPASGPCGLRSFSAVARDSAKQTASDEADVTVTDPNDCEGAPELPTVSFVDPPDSIGQDGAVIAAEATADGTVESVGIKLGNSTACIDTTAPYECEVLPTGAQVGDQILRAIVTDDLGQTAQAAVPVTVERFDPKLLSIQMEKTRLSKKKVQRSVFGKVQMPQRVSPGTGCAAGTVTLNVQRNGVTLFPSSQVDLKPDCTYRLTFSILEKKKKKKKKPYRYDFGAVFSGNAVLNEISATGSSR